MARFVSQSVYGDRLSRLDSTRPISCEIYDAHPRYTATQAGRSCRLASESFLCIDAIDSQVNNAIHAASNALMTVHNSRQTDKQTDRQ